MTVIAAKACTQCGVVSSDFTAHATHRDGLQSVCRACNREAQRRRRLKPEARAKDAAADRRRRADPAYRAKRHEEDHRERRNPETWGRTVLRGIKSRAKARGLAFDLSPSDLVLPERCPVLGIVLKIGADGRGISPNSPSVDRLDNCRGYTADNVRIISNRANLLKKDATRAEIRALLAYMEMEGAP